jgi:hypothetical protein
LGLRLSFLYWWTPNYIIQRELSEVSNQTSEALKTLIATYAPKALVLTEQKHLPTNIKEQRAMMAQTHTKLVKALEAAVGYEKAVALGRESLFTVGVNLGKQTRGKLGVNDNPKDLIKAAKILYRILGIEFNLEWRDDSNAVAIINRCALAEQYSKLTCEILSATDEGVIKGLQPNVTMQFAEYMTSGCQNCRANIQFNQKENLA